MIIEKIVYTVACDNCGTTDNLYWNTNELAESCALNFGSLKEGDKHYCSKCFSYDDGNNIIIKPKKMF